MPTLTIRPRTWPLQTALRPAGTGSAGADLGPAGVAVITQYGGEIYTSVDSTHLQKQVIHGHDQGCGVGIGVGRSR